MKLTSVGIAVAKRDLELDGKPDVSIVLGKPEPFPDGNGFYCPYQISGIGKQAMQYAGGEDSVQAIILALKKIGADLYTSPEAKAGRLTWDCGTTKGDLGFPVPDSIRDLAPS